MSDLFKDHGPKLSDDEDRRLWQRVRAIPEEVAPARAPWWRALWAMPAVRYGAPAFAVLLVAVVWVAERRPEPPARVAATHAVGEPDRKLDAPPAADQTPWAKTPAAPQGARSRDELKQDRKLTDVGEPTSKPENEDQAAGRADGGAVLEKEVQLQAAPQARPAAPAKDETQNFAGAPPAPAREQASAKSAKAASPPPAPSVTSWGAMRSTAPDQLESVVGPGAGDRLAAGTLPSAAELAHHAILSDVLNPAHGGDLVAWVRLPDSAPWKPVGWQADWTVSIMSGETGATGGDGVNYVSHERLVEYDSASARARVAVLAYLFEKSLTAPDRGHLEALRKAALAIDPVEGGYGRSRLLTLLDGALGAASGR